LGELGLNAKEKTIAKANAPVVKIILIFFILKIALLTQKAIKTLMKKKYLLFYRFSVNPDLIAIK